MKIEQKLRVSLITLSLLTLVSSSSSSQVLKGKPNAPQHGVKYQPLNVKPGLWDRTLTFKRSGKMPIPAGMLDNLTPEQRARLEARMNASSSAEANTLREKTCITRQELEEPINFTDQECSWTILESTGQRARGNVSCKAAGITMTGTGDFEALDQEHMRGTAHMTSTGGGNRMTYDATFSSKWLKSSCGNVP